MSLKEQSLEAERDRLRVELEKERKRHAQTVETLEKARRSAKKKRSVPNRQVRTSRSDEIREVVVGDVHGNKADPQAVAAFLRDVRSINPHRIVLGGDILDCGGFLAEHHALGFIAETTDSYEDDVAAANLFLDRLQDAAPNAVIHYIEGNHEWRVERWVCTQKLAHQKDMELLRRTFAAENVLRLEERGIHYYRTSEVYSECTVPGWIKLGKVFYTHRAASGQNAASKALRKANGNIIFFDSHRADFHTGYKPGTGLISAWNPGCLCRRQPLYANTNPTEWTHGYIVRFISKKTQNFQVVMVSIDDGESFGDLLFNSN